MLDTTSGLSVGGVYWKKNKKEKEGEMFLKKSPCRGCENESMPKTCSLCKNCVGKKGGKIYELQKIVSFSFLRVNREGFSYGRRVAPRIHPAM